MFQTACLQIRDSLYGIWARTQLPNQMIHSNGSGFAISTNSDVPNAPVTYILTNSHVMHQQGDVNGPLHAEFLVIRSPDIGQNCENASLVAEDTIRDLALIKIEHPRSNHIVTLENSIQQSGTICGCLGFPLSTIEVFQGNLRYNLRERFQGAYISSYFGENIQGRQLNWYEVDRVMYKGSSGCPGFLSNGDIVGVQTRVLLDSPNENEPLERRSLAISLWIPSTEVITFAQNFGIL